MEEELHSTTSHGRRCLLWLVLGDVAHGSTESDLTGYPALPREEEEEGATVGRFCQVLHQDAPIGFAPPLKTRLGRRDGAVGSGPCATPRGGRQNVVQCDSAGPPCAKVSSQEGTTGTNEHTHTHHRAQPHAASLSYSLSMSLSLFLAQGTAHAQRDPSDCTKGVHWCGLNNVFGESSAAPLSHVLRCRPFQVDTFFRKALRALPELVLKWLVDTSSRRLRHCGHTRVRLWNRWDWSARLVWILFCLWYGGRSTTFWGIHCRWNSTMKRLPVFLLVLILPHITQRYSCSFSRPSPHQHQ